MAWDNLYLSNRGGNTYLLTGEKPSSSIEVYDADGNKITSLSPNAGTSGHENNGKAKKFTLKSPIPPGGYYVVDGQKYTIGQGSRQEFKTGSSNPYLDTQDTKGGGGGFAGGGGEFGASQVGDYGVAPAFIGDQFPDPSLIKGADYKFVDPLKFGEEFNPFQRKELQKNFTQAGDFALQAIDTEFKALETYVPKSAKLSREQTALDNQANQANRTAQVNQAVPDVVADLNRVASDARAYASGNAPDSATNAALEIGLRSSAADAASVGGFGVNSSASRKASDLMSARERIGLSQYGEGLLSSNAAQRSQLFLAPTQYSNTGAQVGIAPSVSGSQLQQQSASEVNQASLVSGSTAYQGNINQLQFGANLDQRTQEFNATNENNFALSYFNYLNSYVNSVAGASQTNINTGVGIDQQGAARDEANKQKGKTQNANAIKDTLGAVGSVVGAIFSDKRLKDNIIKFENAFNILDQLPVYTYNYKETETKHVGIMAQDLESLLPDSVILNKSGFLTVNVNDLLFVVMQAVKELKETVEGIQRTVEVSGAGI